MSDNIHRSARVHSLAGRLLPEDRPVSVRVADGVIQTVEDFTEPPGGPRERDLPYLSPAFTDVQVNGYAGHDYSAPELDEGDITAIVSSLAGSGVARHMPTIITNPADLICRNAATIARALEESPRMADAIPGIHIEGPFIAEEDGPRGAHDRQYVRLPDVQEYRRWQDAAAGHIRMVTLAPELPGALSLIEALTRDGVIAAIGHTGAAPQQIRDAVSAGAVISTHLGNGSHGTLPRLSNYLLEQMTDDRLLASIIADGYHLPPSALKAVVRAKGVERLILVSDATALGGSEPGRYKWGNIDVEVHPDGHLGLAGTEFLAGAGHLLDRGIAQVVRTTGISLGDAVRMCTTNPARLLGLPRPEIAPGGRADVVLFDCATNTQSITTRQMLVAGEVVYEREFARVEC